jgi:hypothetical protein
MMTTTAAKKSDAVVKQLNRSQLANVLFNVPGVTFIGADTTTVPDMNLGGRSRLNYMMGNVEKDSIIGCMLGFDYENRRNKIEADKWVESAIAAAIADGIDPETIEKSMGRMKEYSTQSIEKFVAKKRSWGTHMKSPITGKISRIMIEHTKKDKKTKELLPETYAQYMQVEILNAKSPVYRYKDTGEVLSEKDLECVKLYLKPRKDDDLVIRDYGLRNIRNIRINGESYRIVD